MAPSTVTILVGVVAVAVGADGLNRLRREVGRGEVEASARTLLFGASLVGLAALGSLYAVRGGQGVPVSASVRTVFFGLLVVVAVGNYAVGRS